MERVKHHLMESNLHYIKDPQLAELMLKTASMIQFDPSVQ
jgi:hypothetical protein